MHPKGRPVVGAIMLQETRDLFSARCLLEGAGDMEGGPTERREKRKGQREGT